MKGRDLGMERRRAGSSAAQADDLQSLAHAEGHGALVEALVPGGAPIASAGLRAVLQR